MEKKQYLQVKIDSFVKKENAFYCFDVVHKYAPSIFSISYKKKRNQLMNTGNDVPEVEFLKTSPK